jgi:enolase
MKITNVVARQILDSRGNPTIEADVWVEGGVFGRASVPSGASTGKHEAHELRDGKKEYGGLGVKQAIKNINEEITPAIKGLSSVDQTVVDQKMIEIDGTKHKSRLGANAILAVSLAVAHAAAKARNVMLYVHINDIAGYPEKSLPMPMMNFLNGGKHAMGSSDFQEFMIVPVGAKTFTEAVKIGSEIFHALKSIIAKGGFSTAVGDEGGFTHPLKKLNTEMLDFLVDATKNAGYEPGKDVAFAMDVAASEFFTEDRIYDMKAEGRQFDSPKMIDYLCKISKQYPVVSIEDGLDQDDWSAWTKLTSQIGDVQLVGDDLLVTNTDRLKRAINEKAGNAILIKPNQIGTLTETIQAIQLAQKNNWKTVVSHRSGETEDVTIAHLAIGTGAGQIKTGSLSRSERTAKYNELMRIESMDDTLFFASPFS